MLANQEYGKDIGKEVTVTTQVYLQMQHLLKNQKQCITPQTQQKR